MYLKGVKNIEILFVFNFNFTVIVAVVLWLSRT